MGLDGENSRLKPGREVQSTTGPVDLGGASLCVDSPLFSQGCFARPAGLKLLRGPHKTGGGRYASMCCFFIIAFPFRELNHANPIRT